MNKINQFQNNSEVENDQGQLSIFEDFQDNQGIIKSGVISRSKWIESKDQTKINIDEQLNSILSLNSQSTQRQRSLDIDKMDISAQEIINNPIIKQISENKQIKCQTDDSIIFIPEENINRTYSKSVNKKQDDVNEQELDLIQREYSKSCQLDQNKAQQNIDYIKGCSSSSLQINQKKGILIFERQGKKRSFGSALVSWFNLNKFVQIMKNTGSNKFKNLTKVQYKLINDKSSYYSYFYYSRMFKNVSIFQFQQSPFSFDTNHVCFGII